MSCAHFTTGVPCTAAHCTPHATRIPAYTHHRPHLFGWRLHSKHHWCTSPCTAAHCTSHATRNPACAHHITSTSTRHTQSCMRSPHYLNKHTPHALVLALTTITQQAHATRNSACAHHNNSTSTRHTHSCLHSPQASPVWMEAAAVELQRAG
jgi:hypothetical protein